MEHGEEGFSGIFAVFRLVASGDERAIFFFLFVAVVVGVAAVAVVWWKSVEMKLN